MRLDEAQDLLEFLLIKSDHRLAIDEGHRRGPEAQLHEFLECSLVRPDVFDNKRDAMLRKKLLLPIARPSPGLRIYHYLLRHCYRLRFWPAPEESRKLQAVQTASFACTTSTIRDRMGSVNGCLAHTGGRPESNIACPRRRRYSNSRTVRSEELA